MLKKRASSIIVFAIIIFVYVLAVLLIPFNKGLNAWIGFGFSVFALGASFGLLFTGLLTGGSLKNKVYSLPLLKNVRIYLILQMIVTVALYITDAFDVEIPLWAVIIVNVILTAYAAITFITVLNVREHIIDTDKAGEVSTKAMKRFTVNLTGLSSSVADAGLKKKLEKLAEDFRYSDPVSSDATEEAERIISYEVEVLRTAVYGGDFGVISRQADRVSTLLADRNRICKASK